MVTYHKANTDDELNQILEVQSQNLRVRVDESTQLTDGFVTLQHDFDLLKRMNDTCPHIIAKDGYRVVGFTLSMLTGFRSDIPLLEGMFNMANSLYPDMEYLVMGQVCVAEDYRGKGIFRGLYTHMQMCYKNDFDPLITIVAKKNIRSLNAHKAVGFKTIDSEADVDWVFIVWDWNAHSERMLR